MNSRISRVVSPRSGAALGNPRVVLRRIPLPGNIRALRARMLFPSRDRRRPAGELASRILSRADVAFEVHHDSEGRLFIGLGLTREGQPAAGGKVFTFELTPKFTRREAEMLVNVLNGCVMHLGMVAGADLQGRESDHP